VDNNEKDSSTNIGIPTTTEQDSQPEGNENHISDISRPNETKPESN